MIDLVNPWTVACLVAFCVGIFAFIESLPFGAPRLTMAERLRRYEPEYWSDLSRQERRAAAMKPLQVSHSMLRPLLEEIGATLQSGLERVGLRQPNLVETLAWARPSISVTQYFGEKVLLFVLGTGFIPATVALGLHVLERVPIWGWAALGLVCFAAPDWWLASKREERRTRLLMELPTTLSMLAISLSAGKSIEEAIRRVAESSDGLMAQELGRVQRELSLGQRYLVPALEVMAARNLVPELETVVGHIAAASTLGLSLVETLRTEAASLRERKRLRIVEEGGKGTIRMVLPVAVFILPVLFVVLLAPAAVEVAAWGS